MRQTHFETKCVSKCQAIVKICLQCTCSPNPFDNPFAPQYSFIKASGYLKCKENDLIVDAGHFPRPYTV